MPVMSLETYLDRVKGGEDEKAVLIDIAVDYAGWYRYSAGVSTVRWHGEF